MIQHIETEAQLESNLRYVDTMLDTAKKFEEQGDERSRDSYLESAIRHLELIERDLDR